MLLNPYRFASPSALLTSLVSYWRFEEASGDLIDSHGANHLEDFNTVTSAIGKVANARSFARASNEYFNRVSGASLSMGDTDFTFAVWVKPNTTNNGIISKWIHSGPENEFYLANDASRFNFVVKGPGGQSSVVDNGTGITLGIWHHVIVWHDSVNNQIGMAWNGGAARFIAHSGGVFSYPAAVFNVGSTPVLYSTMDGQIDELGFWQRILTPAERTELYNAGNGLTHPFDGSIPPAPTAPIPDLLSGLVSYWKMDEASGNALDAHGANTLTDTNTVGAAVGKISGARNFQVASSEYFKLVAGASLSTGDIDFTFSAWARLETSAAERNILSIWNWPASQIEFILRYTPANLVFYVNGSGGYVGVFTGGALALNTWYHIVCWHDSVNNQIGLAVNNIAATVSHAAGVTARPAQEFRLGAEVSGGYWHGSIDEVGFWKRRLTASERTYLYNAGNGRTYPFT